MSLASGQMDEIDLWTGRLLMLAGGALLLEAVTDFYGQSLSAIPFSWLFASIPFGIGFALTPIVLLRSYQSLVDRTPTSTVVGVAFVAVLPVGTIVLVVWAVLGLAVGPVPEIAVLPVRVGIVFFALLASFSVGVALFGLVFLREEQTRSLGTSLLTFGTAWAAPLVVVTLTGVYPGWLATLLVVTVATTMIAIGYCFPPVEFAGGR